jgi:hypothetical protein
MTHDQDSSFPSRLVRWALRVVVAAQCIGVAWKLHVTDTAIFSVLWGQADIGGFGWTESSALLVEDVACWALVIAAAFTLLRPCLFVLAPVALWQLAMPLADWWTGGIAWTQLSEPLQLLVAVTEHAVRVAAPLTLAIWDPWRARNPSPLRMAAGHWLLRLAAAATFICHGYKAILHQPLFIDYLIAAGSRLLGMAVSEDMARGMLTVIGWTDVALGLMLISRRWRLIAAYMAFWGFVTAGARIVYAGWPASYEALLRAANGGAPLVLLFYWYQLAKRKLRTPEAE